MLYYFSDSRKLYINTEYHFTDKNKGIQDINPVYPILAIHFL